MRITFTRASRKHRIGRASARAAIESAGEPIEQIDGALLWIGVDERGRELEIIGVPLWDQDIALIVHVMPTAFRRKR